MRKSKESGFTVVMIVAIVPMLLLALSILSAGCILLLKWRQTHELCQRSLYQTQKKAGDRFNELFGLNPEATRLRAERKAAEHAMKLAIFFPPAFAAAEAYYTSVVQRQIVLRAKQESLKTLIRVEGNRNLHTLSNELRSERGIDGWPTITPLRLSIRQSPPAALTPNHDPLNNFSILQAVKGRWMINPGEVFPKWLTRFVPKLDRVAGTCAATLKLKGDQWVPVLGEGKFSLNY
jgi:hypothetical protein